MKKAIFGVLVGIGLTGGAVAQELAHVPVHSKPIWQVVQSVPESPGSPIAVRSLSTNQIIGALPVDHKFLAFGGNGQIVTMAFNGEVGYVPVAAVSPLYPQIPKQEKPPAGPNTLEDLAEQYEEKVTGRVAVNLQPSDSVVTRVRQGGVVGEGAVPGNPGAFGGGTGIDPFGGQPGAALAGGGVQGIGGMVNSGGGGYMGGK